MTFVRLGRYGGRVDCLFPRWEMVLIACLHDQKNIGFFEPIKSFLKTFQTALIVWKKVSPPKKPLLY